MGVTGLGLAVNHYQTQQGQERIGGYNLLTRNTTTW